MSIDKSFTKKDLSEIITLYEMDIEDYDDLKKSDIQLEILSYLKYNNITYIHDFPDVHNSQDLINFLCNPKPNNELNYKKKQEVIKTAKLLIQYCKSGYSLALTNYKSVDQIYDNGIMVGAYCDIPTCRRAIKLLNDDPKIRNKIAMKMSSKVRMELESKDKIKTDLTPKLRVLKGRFDVVFD